MLPQWRLSKHPAALQLAVLLVCASALGKALVSLCAGALIDKRDDGGFWKVQGDAGRQACMHACCIKSTVLLEALLFWVRGLLQVWYVVRTSCDIFMRCILGTASE